MKVHNLPVMKGYATNVKRTEVNNQIDEDFTLLLCYFFSWKNLYANRYADH